MGASTSNAVFFLVTTLIELYLFIIALRIILQWVRADFYNPISQLIWHLTQPILGPLQKILPRWRTLDVAGVLLLFVVGVIYIQVVAALLGYRIDGIGTLYFTVLKLITLMLNLYTFALFVQAILSWVGPGVNNPAGSILWSMNEPLMRPVRRVIPPISGLDLTPLLLILVLQFINLLIPLPGIFR
jgi:YggT family protein